jgi:hypothetical protein
MLAEIHVQRKTATTEYPGRIITVHHVVYFVHVQQGDKERCKYC